MSRLYVVALALAVSVACTGRGDTGKVPETDLPETDVETDTSSGCTGGGFAVTGVATSAQDDTPLGGGLCVAVADPGPALLGQPPEVLGTGTTEDDGSYQVCGVETDSTIGLIIVVDDCEGSDDTVSVGASGIAHEDYAELGDGDSLDGRVAYAIPLDWMATIESSLVTAGADDDLAGGGLIGFARLESDGSYLPGVTVTGNNITVYYGDDDDSDGLFTDGANPNTSTIVAGRSLYVIPGAPIQNYSATDGEHTFTGRLAGSFPGYAVFVDWLAE